MLLLPTGQVLFAAETNEIYAYTYFSCPDVAWTPHITSGPSVVHKFFSYSLSGRLFNGMSQAVGYGDDASAATNYPLVRIQNNATGNIRYCRTFDHSTMAVATGTAIVSTNFYVPGNIEEGPSELCVIANGIQSPCTPVDIRSFPINDINDLETLTRIKESLIKDHPWVIGPNGPISIDSRNPKFANTANRARKLILNAIQESEKIGREVAAQRKKKAEQVKVAPDEGSEEAEEMEREAKKRMRKRKRNK